jgi:hypothetical protein
MEVTASYLAVVAAFLSALATGFAVWAAIYGPRAAAEAAEQMRRQSDADSERRRIRMWVFTTLMQQRATVASELSVQALNVIDVAFQDQREVRDAWSELYISFGQKPLDNNKIEERLRELLRRMAISLSIAETLRVDDFSRIYFPTALADEQYVRTMQRDAVKRQLEASSLSPLANTAAPMTQPDPIPSKMPEERAK